MAAISISNPGVRKLVEELKMIDSPIASRVLTIESYVLRVEQENRDLKDRVRKLEKQS